MQKNIVVIVSFLILFFVSSGFSIAEEKKLVGGDILKVDFSFYNSSNIPLTNKILDVKLKIAGEKLQTSLDYPDTFIVFPEKNITFSFSYPLPIDYYGNLKVWLEVYKNKKIFYVSKPIEVEISKNYHYYLLKKAKERYKEELKIWKDFSDRPAYYFSNRQMLPKVIKAVKKLQNSPLIKKVFSEDDYYMLKVTLHRINFFLKKHPVEKSKIEKDGTKKVNFNEKKSEIGEKPKKQNEVESKLIKINTSVSPNEISKNSSKENAKNNPVGSWSNFPIIAFFYHLHQQLQGVGVLLAKKVLFYVDKWTLVQNDNKSDDKAKKKDSQEDYSEVVKKLQTLAQKEKQVKFEKKMRTEVSLKKKYFYLVMSIVIFVLTLITLKKRLAKKDTFNKDIEDKLSKAFLKSDKESEASTEGIISRLDDRL